MITTFPALYISGKIIFNKLRFLNEMIFSVGQEKMLLICNQTRREAVSIAEYLRVHERHLARESRLDQEFPQCYLLAIFAHILSLFWVDLEQDFGKTEKKLLLK